jgi:hypothetical protein
VVKRKLCVKVGVDPAPLTSLRLIYGALRQFNIKFSIKPTKWTIRNDEAGQQNAMLLISKLEEVKMKGIHNYDIMDLTRRQELDGVICDSQ